MEYLLLPLGREAQALDSLNASIDVLEKAAFDSKTIVQIIQAGIFTPKQDSEIAEWFARFLSLKQNLWAVLDNAIEETGGTPNIISRTISRPKDETWAYFLLGYSAVCSLVRLDRFLLNKLAYDPIFQRKLNEGFQEYRIERKQWTATYRALTLPNNAFKILMAHIAFRMHRREIKNAIETLPLREKHKSLLLRIYASMPQQQRHLDLRWYHWLKARISYRYHAWRRRNASIKQQSAHALLEYSGRIVAEIRLPTEKRVSQNVLEQLRPILRAGDILITRHNGALTNLFLPGFWPHAALYIGDNQDMGKATLPLKSPNLGEWKGEICTFEALKDGVHFRALETTLSVDAFVVLRPNLSKEVIDEAIARVIIHAGKGYNFDFDLFRSDQLVCTEVIYRAYDGIGGTNMPLTERLGKKTLSAEDLLDFSLDTQWATPVAIYGTSTAGDQKIADSIIVGDEVMPTLIASYR